MTLMVDEYMMLLQTQNGEKVIVDTRPALRAQLRKTLITFRNNLRPLPDYKYRYFFDFEVNPGEWKSWLEEAGLPMPSYRDYRKVG